MMQLFSVENLFWAGFAAAAAALGFAGYLTWRVWKLPRDGAYGDFARRVGKGAVTFLRRQAMVCAPLFALALAALAGLYALGLLDSPYYPLAFLSGGVCAAGAGLFSLWVSLRAAAGTAGALEGGTWQGFNTAFSAAAAGAFFTLGLALLEVTGWFFVLKYAAGADAEVLAGTILLFGAGAACAALLSRIGAGIFAKAADLGADPGGEDAPVEPLRDPGAVADCVGKAVTGAAASCDAYSGYVLALLTALYAGAAAYGHDGMAWNAMLFPVMAAAAGCVCSVIAALLVKAGENAGERELLVLLGKGSLVGAGLTAMIAAPASYLLTGSWAPWFALAVGLLAGLAVSALTVRSSSGLFRPARRVASAAENGAGAQLSEGTGLGLRSAAAVLCVWIAALLAAFLCGGGLLDAAYESLYSHALARGFYGVALAGVGLLSGLGFSLSAVLYAPAADCAGCLRRGKEKDKAMRERAAALSAVGLSTAAVGRALSSGCTVLTAPVLLWAYAELARAGAAALSFALTGPAVLCGALLGAAAVYLFVSLLLSGVRSCVQPMTAELRRQNRSRMRDRGEADFTACVDLCARSSAIRTLAPGLFAAAPVLTGALLGAEGTAGFLGGVLAVALIAAMALSAAGAALDSARRRVGSERKGGAEARAAAALTDRIGGVCRDVAGPCLTLLARFFLTSAPLLLPLARRVSLLSLLG